MKKLITAVLLSILISPNLAFAKDTDISIKGEIKMGSLGKAIQVVEQAAPGDTITIHLQTPGGNTYEALSFCKAIFNSRAKQITAVVDEYAYSAGADIAACTDKIEMAPQSALLFHLGSSQDPLTRDMIIYSDDMNFALLDSTNVKYVLLREKLEYDFLNGLGFPKRIAIIAWHGANGLAFRDDVLKQLDPTGEGNRKNVIIQKDVDEMLNFFKTGE